ncbi:MAG: peptidase, partial [Lachnospiraceae bacterium]|nr:peptidase [Lachnospiraceae bacterium]
MSWKRIVRLWETAPKTTDRIDKKPHARLFLLQGVLVLIFAVLLHRLWELQIVNGPKYAEEFELKTTRIIKDGSLRGNIYDRNGEVLAYNKLVYTVTMVDNVDYPSGRERQLGLNGMIYKVLKKLEENGEQLNNELKIMVGPDGGYEYTVTGKALERFKADIFGEADPADMSEEQSGMSADEMVRFLAGNDRFALYGEGKKTYTAEELQEHGLPASYTQEEVLAIVGIRYMLSLNAWRKYVPVTLAGDVSEKTVAYIKENNECLSGIDIGQEWERVYDGGEAFSHILGYVGKISAEELEAYEGSAKDYTVDSIVGKTGIEQYLEEELQGVDGERHIIVNNVGKVVGEETIVREAVSGRDVYLSIDKNLQIDVYHILEQKLADIIAANLINVKEFDKSGLADTTEIRIPIYDVYIALFENQVIRTEDFYRSNATELEQSIAEAWEREQEEVIEALKKELLEGDTGYCDLS